MTQHAQADHTTPMLPNVISVGQGFDIYGTYDYFSFLGSLFDPKASTSQHTVNGQIYQVPDYIEALDIAKDDEKKHSGVSREQFQQSISATAKIDAKYGAFSGQFTTSFSMVENNIAEYMYAYTTYYDWIYQMQLKPGDGLQQYLSESFKEAVKKLPDTANTPAELNAFVRFFSTYGAYYTRQVTVGATLEFYVAVSTTSNLSATSVRAAMEAHYKGLFTTGSVNAEFKKTNVWQSYSQNSVIELKVAGGDDATRAKLSAIDTKEPGKETVDAYQEWKSTKATLPIVTYFQLAPITNLCGEKAEVVGTAWGKIWPTLHPELYIETTSDSASGNGPVAVLSSKSEPITPTNPRTSNCGCMVAVLNRNTLETEFARYYCINPDQWARTYTAMYNQVALDISQGGFNDQRYVLIFVTMGLSGAAVPTTNLYSLLLSAGAGTGLQQWREAPKGYANYVLVGVPSRGVGKGAESYNATAWPAIMKTGAYFYKGISNLPYEVALKPSHSLSGSEETAEKGED